MAMAVHAGEKLHRPDAEFLCLHTSFAIGGVPPLGHDQPLTSYITEIFVFFALFVLLFPQEGIL